KDSYTLDVDADALDRAYDRIYQAYHAIFERVGVPAVAVEADSGAMGGRTSHEFVLRHPQGEDAFVQCEQCGYAANVEAAAFAIEPGASDPPEPARKVATPDCKTI